MCFLRYKLYFKFSFLFLFSLNLFSNHSNDTIYHTVLKGETLFSISKKYQIEVGNLKIWNNLKDNNLSINQNIIILSKINNEESQHEEVSQTYEEKFPGILKEEGFAASIEDSTQTTKYLALHKNAEIGTILLVKNQMNNLKVMVRVIGKLPDTGQNDKIIIRLSKVAYSKLDPIDPIIPVELSYIKE